MPSIAELARMFNPARGGGMGLPQAGSGGYGGAVPYTPPPMPGTPGMGPGPRPPMMPPLPPPQTSFGGAAGGGQTSQQIAAGIGTTPSVTGNYTPPAQSASYNTGVQGTGKPTAPPGYFTYQDPGTGEWKLEQDQKAYAGGSASFNEMGGGNYGYATDPMPTAAQQAQQAAFKFDPSMLKPAPGVQQQPTGNEMMPPMLPVYGGVKPPSYGDAQGNGVGWNPGTGNAEWEKAATANLNVPLHGEGNAGRGYMPDPNTGRMVPRGSVEGQGGYKDNQLGRLDAIAAGGGPRNNGRDDGTVQNMAGGMGRGGPARRQAQQQQDAAMKAQWVREGKNPAVEMQKYQQQQKSNYAQDFLNKGDMQGYAGYAVSNMDPSQWDKNAYGAIQKTLQEQSTGAQNWMSQMAQNDPSMQFQGPNPYQGTVDKNQQLLAKLKAMQGYIQD